MFVNSSSTTGNQWEFRPGTCETWAYLESIVHYWQTWKSITVLAPSMNGRLLSDFFPFCSTKCLGNFAVAVSNDLFFQIFKQSSWKQNKWCTIPFLTPRKTGKKRRSATKSASFHDIIRNFTEERLRLLFHQLFMHLPLLIFHGQRTGLEKFRAWEWVGLNDHGLALQPKKMDNKNTFLGINYWKQTFWWHMQQYSRNYSEFFGS